VLLNWEEVASRHALIIVFDWFFEGNFSGFVKEDAVYADY